MFKALLKRVSESEIKDLYKITEIFTWFSIRKAIFYNKSSFFKIAKHILNKIP